MEFTVKLADRVAATVPVRNSNVEAVCELVDSYQNNEITLQVLLKGIVETEESSRESSYKETPSKASRGIPM